MTAPPPPQLQRRAAHGQRAPAIRETVAPSRLADARPARETPAVRPAFHCDWRLRPSEQMVCADPELASLDRQLNHAFNLAVRAGASREALREQQDDWEMARERAARRSRGAVADLYRDRIDDLMAIAERRGGFEPG